MTQQDRERVTREHLKRYQKDKKRIRELNEDIAAGQLGSRHDGDPVQTSFHSDPTARGAEQLLSLIESEEWIAAIDAAMSELKRYQPLIEQLMRLHFRLEYASGYKRRYQGRLRRDLMELQAISEREFYNRIEVGIQTVMVHAAARGLFRFSSQ